jgi:hypothetical protein
MIIHIYKSSKQLFTLEIVLYSEEASKGNSYRRKKEMRMKELWVKI